MKLDELKKMIAEEFESYMKEDDVDVSVGADDVDAEMGGDMEQNPEEALEKIYQMLQAYFEKDGEVVGWWLCRLSDTEPIFVMRAEAINDENLTWIKSEVNRMISPHLDITEFLNQD